MMGNVAGGATAHLGVTPVRNGSSTAELLEHPDYSTQDVVATLAFLVAVTRVGGRDIIRVLGLS